eukprot:SAG22_NODE_276_length_13167_cov_8.415825_12_plen_70_part_00
MYPSRLQVVSILRDYDGVEWKLKVERRRFDTLKFTPARKPTIVSTWISMLSALRLFNLPSRPTYQWLGS